NRSGRRVVRTGRESGTLVAAEAWEKSVAALRAEQQVEAVVRRLKELNPAFDGTVKHEIDDGVVRKLSFLSDDVADISPVRALKMLRQKVPPAFFRLKCECSTNPGIFIVIPALQFALLSKLQLSQVRTAWL